LFHLIAKLRHYHVEYELTRQENIMDHEYIKTKPISIREAGKNESWLQKKLEEDPSILGLGSFTLIQSQRMQHTGGRIDLLLEDSKAEVRYAVEIMLGTVDESHIIRTIEYWDLENRGDREDRYEHKAVIVAEDFSQRFFNVITLLNKVVPMIAVKLSAFRVKSKLCLNFVKVLDITEENSSEQNEPTTRKDWEESSSEISMQILDKVVALMPRAGGKARVKYNLSHVAVGSARGTNFCWINPRRGPRLRLSVWIGEERDAFMKKLAAKGVDVRPDQDQGIRIFLTMDSFEKNKNLIKVVLTAAEARSS
jgi:hypothetical protein